MWSYKSKKTGVYRYSFLSFSFREMAISLFSPWIVCDSSVTSFKEAYFINSDTLKKLYVVRKDFIAVYLLMCLS